MSIITLGFCLPMIVLYAMARSRLRGVGAASAALWETTATQVWVLGELYAAGVAVLLILPGEVASTWFAPGWVVCLAGAFGCGTFSMVSRGIAAGLRNTGVEVRQATSN